MRTILTAALVALAICPSALAQNANDKGQSVERPAKPVPGNLRKILASGDGLAKETAFKASSIAQEYRVIAYLGYELETQALVVDGKPYDLMRVIDRKTGEHKELWFDISSFFGKGF